LTDAKGRRYDIPVVVGALAASPEIYAVGMGSRSTRSQAWMQAIANPIAPVTITAALQETVITGDDLKGKAGRSLADSHACRCRSRPPASTPRRTSRDALRNPAIRQPASQNMGTYRAP